MAYLFLANNLLGHVNTTVTTVELCFLWCMVKKVKVHLGYWLAHSCHKIAHHPVRRLYACHLVGAYLLRNVRPEITVPRSSMALCEDPEWFDTDYFINIGLIEETEEGLVFCGPEQVKGEGEEKADEKEHKSEEAVEVEVSPEKPSPAPAKTETPEMLPESSEQKSGDMEEKWQRIIEFMM